MSNLRDRFFAQNDPIQVCVRGGECGVKNVEIERGLGSSIRRRHGKETNTHVNGPDLKKKLQEEYYIIESPNFLPKHGTRTFYYFKLKKTHETNEDGTPKIVIDDHNKEETWRIGSNYRGLYKGLASGDSTFISRSENDNNGPPIAMNTECTNEHYILLAKRSDVNFHKQYENASKTPAEREADRKADRKADSGSFNPVADDDLYALGGRKSRRRRRNNRKSRKQKRRRSVKK
jgi:hypothetical protein